MRIIAFVTVPDPEPHQHRRADSHGAIDLKRWGGVFTG
jgi:hypothetical protein